jgi:predicted ester cyclase
MSIKENKELLHDMIKEWNELAGDVSKIRSLYTKYYAPGYISHHLHRGDLNLEQAIQDMVSFVSSFPDFKYSIDELLAEGDKVILRYTSESTHKGTFGGIPATGKKVVVKGVEIYKIAGDQIVESWDFHDSLGGMLQMGFVPRPAPDP